MFNCRAILFSTALAGLFAGAMGGPAPAEAQNDNRYYRCESGWSFEVKNNAARCRRGGGLAQAALLPCVQATLPTGQKVGTSRRQDYTGTKDMCVTTLPGIAVVALESRCPLAHDKVQRKGLDHCVRPDPLQVKAPSVSVLQQ
jgi:hypothetical protein